MCFHLLEIMKDLRYLILNMQTDDEVSFHSQMKEFPVWFRSTPQAPDQIKVKRNE